MVLTLSTLVCCWVCVHAGVTLLQATFRGRKERATLYGTLLISPLRATKLANKELLGKMDVVSAVAVLVGW